MTPLPPQPSPPPSGGSDTAISPGEIVLWVSGGLAFILSFLPWVSDGIGGDSVNSWGSLFPDVFGLFPIATYVPLWVFGAALISVIKRFGNVSFGMEQYVGFGGAHLQRAFPIFALFLGMGWVVALSESRGIAMWLSVLAAIGAIAGNVMIDRLPAKPKAVAAPGQWGAPPGPAPGYAAPQPPPGGFNAPQPGYGQQPGYPPPAPQPQPPQPQPPSPQPPAPAPQPPAPQPPAPQPGPPPPAPQPQPPAPQPQPGPPPAPPAPPAPGDWQTPPPSPPG